MIKDGAYVRYLLKLTNSSTIVGGIHFTKSVMSEKWFIVLYEFNELVKYNSSESNFNILNKYLHKILESNNLNACM